MTPLLEFNENTQGAQPDIKPLGLIRNGLQIAIAWLVGAYDDGLDEVEITEATPDEQI